ncbi:FG-nucleoporin nsp1 [Arachnomyces sp. PD_36]|nr:FG-nucleoporin nsp1 [Arachnomyces sp. PD_36]
MAFNFGGAGTTSGAGSSGSLFGTAGQTGASPFASNQNKPGATGGGIFGNAGAPAAATTNSSAPSMFGSAQSTPGQGGSTLFGAAANPSGNKPGGALGGSTSTFSFGQANNNNPQSSTPATSGFLTPNKPGETAAPTPAIKITNPSSSQPTGMFANTAASGAPKPNLFGSATPATSGGGGLSFGNASTTPAGPPPLGTSAGQGQSLFGQATQKPQVAGNTSNLFGAKPPTTTPAPAAAPGGTPQSQPASNLFGAMGQQGSKPNPFGAPTPGGGLGKQPESSQATPSNALANAAPLSSDASKPSNLFGQAGATPKFPSTTPAGQPAGGFSFPGANANTASSASTAAPTPAPAKAEAKSLFSNLGNNAASNTPTSTPAPAASNLFSAVKPAASSAAPAPAATTASQPAAGASNLFANIAKPATSTPQTSTPAASAPAPTAPASKPAETTTAPAAASAAPAATPAAAPATSTPNLGASTAGPVPPAQSRLKNKTMDEIITRWATDLTTYQKEFQSQAEKVAMWDRMLAENSNKVQKLFANTVDAERATQEVERQLASVEGQQDELSAWLDRYEREVDDMTAKQVGPGESLQGPDQERERTYKLAEKLSDRLNDMGKDLTSMIEEVNGVSATLSKTSKSDEPISQIVRILNSHLSQLQLIDQGTATLQAKVSAAQRAGSTLGSNFGGSVHQQGMNGSGYGQSVGPGGGGGGAADDFYRSYMGRR